MRNAAAIGLALCAGVAAAEPPDPYRDGVDYLTLPIVVETRDPARIEVVEVFSYGCIHCYRLQPTVSRWRAALPDDVDFRRMHLVMERVRPLAQAFFAAEGLDVLDQVHMPIFEAIHEYGYDLSRPANLRGLFAREAGVADADFDGIYESFGIRSRINQADGLARAYRIRATPTLVVNGRYLVEVPRSGNEAMLLIANALIDRERARMADESADSTP